jgi:RHS repeat-associated protein
MTEADGAQTTWSYDDLYQLTREVKRNGAGAVIHDTSYTYDLAHNRTSMTNHLTQSTTSYTYNAMNQMLTAGNMSFTYDANGNTVSKAVSGQTTTYTWDYENKLTRIDYPNGSSNTFTTNADGVRMTANDSGGNRRFIYDGTSIVGEQDISSGNFIAVYDYGNGGLARQVRGTGASYYQYDGLGSTRQLTDASQAVTDTTSYDAWGNVLSSSGTTANPFKYVGSLGYYADADNGLMLLGARYYGAGVGRFWSVDPIRDTLNWYACVRNNPANGVDPTGMSVLVTACLVGAIVSIIDDLMGCVRGIVNGQGCSINFCNLLCGAIGGCIGGMVVGSIGWMVRLLALIQSELLREVIKGLIGSLVGKPVVAGLCDRLCCAALARLEREWRIFQSEYNYCRGPCGRFTIYSPYP